MKKKSILVIMLLTVILFGFTISVSIAISGFSTSNYTKTYSLASENNTYILDVVSYKQYHPVWANNYIGDRKIGDAGCLLTSLSMKYSYQTNTSTYPNIMKNKLKFSNNDLIWSSVSKLGYCYTNFYNCTIDNSIMSIIYQKLISGKPVIIGGKANSGSQHWIVITGYKGNSNVFFQSSDFTINDPNSTSRILLSHFLADYPTILRLIY